MPSRKSLTLLSTVEEAFDFASTMFDVNDFPNGGEFLISYLWPHKIPMKVLRRYDWCINFHPAPPHLRGRGCASRALWNGDTYFGVTVHHMSEELDAGQIISVTPVAILETDTYQTLMNRARRALFDEFEATLYSLSMGKYLPTSGDFWSGELWDTKRFIEWMTLDASSDPASIDKMIRCCAGSKPGPYLRSGKHTFSYERAF